MPNIKNFLGLLTLLFIGLKLIGTITWSWWLVLLPFYGLLAALVGVAVVSFVIGTFLYLFIWIAERLKF